MQIPTLAKRTVLYLLAGFGALVLITVSFVFISLGGFGSSNKAQNDLKPILNTLKELGAKKLCDNGDGGHGIDNNAPWYETYYQVNDTPMLESQISSAAKNMGYKLGPDSTSIKQLKGESGYTNSTYLIGHSNGGELDVRIAHSGDSVSLYCGTGSGYGKAVSPSANEAILDINLSLPQ